MNMFFRLIGITAFAAITMSSAQARGDAAHGKAVTEKLACTSCHGPDFNTPTDPAYPRLAGQHYSYLVEALHAYQRGADQPNGRQNPIMQGMAGQLSAQDVQDVATYISELKGVLVSKR